MERFFVYDAEWEDALRDIIGTSGGISRTIAAVRSTGLVGKIALNGHGMMDVAREAGLDGTMILSIGHGIRVAEMPINARAGPDPSARTSPMNDISPDRAA